MILNIIPIGGITGKGFSPMMHGVMKVNWRTEETVKQEGAVNSTHARYIARQINDADQGRLMSGRNHPSLFQA